MTLLRYLLHGATNWKSSNFGDFLYAYEIYRCLKSNAANQVGVYDPSDFFIKYLNADHRMPLDNVRIKDADAMIYIPGGYFGEGHDARLRDTLIQYIRFMPFGLMAIRHKKKLLIIGVGAGPIDRWFMKATIKNICNSSMVVTTRDEESQEALEKIGIRNTCEYSDMMLSFELKRLAKETEQTQHVKEMAGENKLLLVHYNHSPEALEKFAGAVKTFLGKHADYKVVVSADSVLPYEEEYFTRFRTLCGCEAFHFIYNDPFELLQLIKMSDTILTCKLHAGVVGCMFGKAVICAAEHPEKTMRFYKAIGREQNCVSLYVSSTEEISERLDCLHDVALSVPKTETEKAMKHWQAMQRVLR